MKFLLIAVLSTVNSNNMLYPTHTVNIPFYTLEACEAVKARMYTDASEFTSKHDWQFACVPKQ